MPTSVLIADDHKILRQGLRSLLQTEPGIEVVAEAKNGREAVRLARDLAPDVVIIDVGMPDLNGVEATHHLLKEVPGTKVIALSMHSDRRFVTGMLAAGACGYLLKDTAFEELALSIRKVMQNEVYLSPQVAGVVVNQLVASQRTGSSDLTSRETEVLQLISEGQSTSAIAETLKISVKTVETHRRQIMTKLELHSVAELTKYAIRTGLTNLDD